MSLSRPTCPTPKGPKFHSCWSRLSTEWGLLPYRTNPPSLQNTHNLIQHPTWQASLPPTRGAYFTTGCILRAITKTTPSHSPPCELEAVVLCCLSLMFAPNPLPLWLWLAHGFPEHLRVDLTLSKASWCRASLPHGEFRVPLMQLQPFRILVVPWQLDSC